MSFSWERQGAKNAKTINKIILREPAVKKPLRSWLLGVLGGVPVLRMPKQGRFSLPLLEQPIYHSPSSLRPSLREYRTAQ
jgi:hypothetical protein